MFFLGVGRFLRHIQKSKPGRGMIPPRLNYTIRKINSLDSADTRDLP